MRILIFYLALTSQLFAQRSLSRESFMVNIRPGLHSIIEDFYQMVALFPEFPKTILPLVQELQMLNSEKEALKSTCPRQIDKGCKEILNALNVRLGEVKALSFRLLTEQNFSSSFYINSLSGLRITSEFDLAVESLKGDINNASFLIASGLPFKKDTFSVIKNFDNLSTLISLSFVEYIPFTYREDFRHFFFNFVHPIQQQISKYQNYQFINRNITSMNFAVNLLNQTLTKKKKTPEGMGPYLSAIHNRWNSLLKFYY
jgi:hypothetical protein